MYATPLASHFHPFATPSTCGNGRKCKTFSRNSFAPSIQCVPRAYKDELCMRGQIDTASRLPLLAGIRGSRPICLEAFMVFCASRIPDTHHSSIRPCPCPASFTTTSKRLSRSFAKSGGGHLWPCYINGREYNIAVDLNPTQHHPPEPSLT